MIKIRQRRNGGGGGKAAAPPPAPAAAAAPAPVVEDTGPDPQMHAELEKQRALRYQAGKLGNTAEGTGTGTTMTETKQEETTTGNNSTILGA